MKRLLFLVLVTTVLVGCQKPKGAMSEPKSDDGSIQPSATIPKAEEAKTPKEAREELQNRVDRYLGGQRDASLFGGSFGIFAVATRVNNIEIIRAVQAYDKDGKPRQNEFRVAIKTMSTRDVTGEHESRELEFDLFWGKGKWEVR